MNERVWILDQAVQGVREAHDIEPYSQAFVFAVSEQFASVRNQRAFYQPDDPSTGFEVAPLTLLNMMLRYGLDDSKRNILFPSRYDLGSIRDIPQAERTLYVMAGKVRRNEGRPDDVETRKTEFESITHALTKITGRRFSEYQDTQNALRVIYLLHRMMRDPGLDVKGRPGRLLSFIKAPPRKFSFETRDAHPAADSRAHSRLLSELKAYVAVEIDPTALGRVDALFDSLVGRVGILMSQLDDLAAESGSRAAEVYSALAEVLAVHDGGSVGDAPQGSGRLDLDLYVHLGMIEFLHFAGGLKEVYDLAHPKVPIVPVLEEMRGAFVEITGRIESEADIRRRYFTLEEATGLLTNRADLIWRVVESALDKRISEKERLRDGKLAMELLNRTVFFEGLQAQKVVRVSLSRVIGACCAVAQAKVEKMRFRAYLFGDNSRGRSIITTLEIPMKLDRPSHGDPWPEAHLQLWEARLDWVRSALEGQSTRAKARLALMGLVLDRAAGCVAWRGDEGAEARSWEPSRIESRLSGFESMVSRLQVRIVPS